MSHTPFDAAMNQMPLRVALGADHAGVVLKAALAARLSEQGAVVLDVGTHDAASVDYPDYGRAVAEMVARGDAACGIVICGSGIGISIAANRVAGARAALCHDAATAALARQHNDANILALGARVVSEPQAQEIVTAFLATPFEGGRHAQRVAKLG